MVTGWGPAVQLDPKLAKLRAGAGELPRLGQQPACSASGDGTLCQCTCALACWLPSGSK